MLIGRGGVVLSRQPWSSFVSSRKRKWWWDGLIIEFARENVFCLVMFTNLFVYFYFFHWRNYLFHFIFPITKTSSTIREQCGLQKPFVLFGVVAKGGGDNNWISVFHFVGVSVCILKAKPCDDQNLFECVDNMPNDSTMTSFNHATILNNHENKEKKVRYPFFFFFFLNKSIHIFWKQNLPPLWRDRHGRIFFFMFFLESKRMGGI